MEVRFNESIAECLHEKLIMTHTNVYKPHFKRIDQQHREEEKKVTDIDIRKTCTSTGSVSCTHTCYSTIKADSECKLRLCKQMVA